MSFGKGYRIGIVFITKNCKVPAGYRETHSTQTDSRAKSSTIIFLKLVQKLVLFHEGRKDRLISDFKNSNDIEYNGFI